MFFTVSRYAIITVVLLFTSFYCHPLTLAGEGKKDNRGFQEKQFDERRVTLIYKTPSDVDQSHQSKAIGMLITIVEEKISNAGFRVFSSEMLDKISIEESILMSDDKQSIPFFQKRYGEAVVIIDFQTDRGHESDGFHLISGTIVLKAYDATTGEHFASVDDEAKSIVKADFLSTQDGFTHLVKKIGPKAVDDLTNTIIKRFETTRPKVVSAFFVNFSLDDHSRIIECLDELGWKYRIASESTGYVAIEIFHSADPTWIKAEMRKSITQKGLNITVLEMAGNRISFQGK